MALLKVDTNDITLIEREKEVFARTYKTLRSTEKHIREKMYVHTFFLQKYPHWDESKLYLKPHYIKVVEYRFGLIPEVNRILSFPDIAKIFNLSLDSVISHYNYAMRDLDRISAKFRENTEA